MYQEKLKIVANLTKYSELHYCERKTVSKATFLGHMGSLYRAKDFEREEALQYQPGQRVELKSRPGVVDIIAEYDPMMVPPIWLANDPKPRYPHELNVLPKPVIGSAWLMRGSRHGRKHPVRQTRSNLTTSGKVPSEVSHG